MAINRKQVDKYLTEIGCNMNSIKEISKRDIEKRIKEKDTQEWKQSNENKTTLKWYRKFKTKISEIKWFRNDEKYKIMERARSNTLKLSWREKEANDRICKMCNEENEELEHFLLECSKLQEIRNKSLLQRPRVENKEELVIRILSMNDESINREILDIIYEMYCTRKRIIENLN